MSYIRKIKQLYKALEDSGFQQYRTCEESLEEAKHDAVEDILNATNYHKFIVSIRGPRLQGCRTKTRLRQKIKA